MYSKDKIIKLILERKYYEAGNYCEECLRQALDKTLVLYMFLIQIAIKELENGENVFFELSEDYHVWEQHYRNLKFLARRLEMDRLSEYRQEIITYINDYSISNTAIITIISCSTINSAYALDNYRKLKWNGEEK